MEKQLQHHQLPENQCYTYIIPQFLSSRVCLEIQQSGTYKANQNRPVPFPNGCRLIQKAFQCYEKTLLHNLQTRSTAIWAEFIVNGISESMIRRFFCDDMKKRNCTTSVSSQHHRFFCSGFQHCFRHCHTHQKYYRCNIIHSVQRYHLCCIRKLE